MCVLLWAHRPLRMKGSVFGHGTATRSKSHWVQHTQKVEQGLLHPTFSSFPPIERLRAFCIMSFSSSWWLYYTQAFRRHCLLDRKLIAKNLIIYRWKNCGSKYWVRLAAGSISCSINLNALNKSHKLLIEVHLARSCNLIKLNIDVNPFHNFLLLNMIHWEFQEKLLNSQPYFFFGKWPDRFLCTVGIIVLLI